ncbi:MAG: hypothetical protein QM772_14455 [Ottowia sp.]|uniref:hypothetical protein n=1 Tax=Ottowia sp. TaxID=1898956 RepID=UPI0039E5B993
MTYKKYLLFLAGVASGLLLGIFILKNYLYFYCDENFSSVYRININFASKLIEDGNYDGALGVLDGLRVAFYDQKRCGASDVGGILIGAGAQFFGGNMAKVNESYKLKEIDYLKNKVAQKKAAR